MTPNRTSEAALAVFIRRQPGKPVRYLVRWNKKWQAFSLVGGHRSPEESFRQCCIREIEEELEIQDGLEFQVAETPLKELLEYSAHSNSTGYITEYKFAIYSATLQANAVIAENSGDRINRWVTPEEVKNGLTDDFLVISNQAQTVLQYLGYL